MLRTKRKWPLIAGLIAAFLIIGITADLFIMAQHTQGAIELPADLPSREMMAQLAANLDRLSKPGCPFTLASALGDMTVLDYADESGLRIMITLESGAAPTAVLAAEPTWQGKYLAASDWLASISGSGKYLLSFVCTQGPLTLVISQENAPAISTAPLEEAIALIQSLIYIP